MSLGFDPFESNCGFNLDLLVHTHAQVYGGVLASLLRCLKVSTIRLLILLLRCLLIPHKDSLTCTIWNILVAFSLELDNNFQALQTCLRPSLSLPRFSVYLRLINQPFRPLEQSFWALKNSSLFLYGFVVQSLWWRANKCAQIWFSFFQEFNPRQLSLFSHLEPNENLLISLNASEPSSDTMLRNLGQHRQGYINLL